MINHSVAPHLIDKDTDILVNATGRFVVVVPKVTVAFRRKIIADTYGGLPGTAAEVFG